MAFDRTQYVTVVGKMGHPIPILVSDLVFEIVAAGRVTVSASQGAAHTMAIVTGKTTITAQIVQILRAGVVVGGDAAISVSGGTITVASGATYVMTAGDVVNWIAIGT